VRPRLLGFRRGGEGGFTKVGDARGLTSSAGGGAAAEAGVGAACSGRLVVDAARGCREVLTAKFLRLRPFRGGGCFCSSKNGALASSDVRGRSMPIEKLEGGGDSGDDPGDGSVALESSTVEAVVVGDESFEYVVESLNVW
jgi:hypothetical protein